LGFLIGLGGSIVIYRIFFHRLRTFPGRRLDAVSKWGAAYIAYRHRRYFATLQDLHAFYGDYVRIGISLSSIFDGQSNLCDRANRAVCQ
jgi:hypothetical protein